jgi:uncharacterized membrane protein
MRLALHLFVFVLAAGIAHIASVFALPHLARHDAFSRLEAGAPLNMLALIDGKALNALPFADPATALAICRYSLVEGPVRLRVPLSETFLTIAFAERRRGIFSSVSDRAATGGSLDIVLATQAQLDRITALDDEDQAIEEIRLRAPGAEGLAILKVVVDRPSSRERAEAVLRAARCVAERLPD